MYDRKILIMMMMLAMIMMMKMTKDIQLDQVHLACRTQLWNLRNSGNTKIF